MLLARNNDLNIFLDVELDAQSVIGKKIYVNTLYKFDSGKFESISCQYYLVHEMLTQFHEATSEERAMLELARDSSDRS